MNKKKEELERIIEPILKSLMSFDPTKQELRIKKGSWAEQLAQAILDAGFVKKENIELDEDKIWEIIAKNLAGKVNDTNLAQNITQIICSCTQDLLKIKEEE